jgi:hypothetical protein
MENTAIQEQTAMQQLLKTLKECKPDINQFTAAELYTVVVREIHNKLPKEREQIEEAWNDCNALKWSAAPKPTAQEYFTTKYKQDESTGS